MQYQHHIYNLQLTGLCLDAATDIYRYVKEGTPTSQMVTSIKRIYTCLRLESKRQEMKTHPKSNYKCTSLSHDYMICLHCRRPQLGVSITYNIYREKAELYAQ